MTYIVLFFVRVVTWPFWVVTRVVGHPAMGPSWRVFVCGDASRSVFLAKQKKSGWSLVA
jgi:hypothetical protein